MLVFQYSFIDSLLPERSLPSAKTGCYSWWLSSHSVPIKMLFFIRMTTLKCSLVLCASEAYRLYVCFRLMCKTTYAVPLKFHCPEFSEEVAEWLNLLHVYYVQILESSLLHLDCVDRFVETEYPSHHRGGPGTGYRIQ